MKFILDKKIISTTQMSKYKYVMDKFYGVNVSTDRKFQDNYCDYYDMNRKTLFFKKKYFDYLEENKQNEALSYREVLTYLCDATGEVHYSFASKLLHTINPENPILDQHVMRLLGFKQKEKGHAKTDVGKGKDKQSRIDYYVNVHTIVKAEYDAIKIKKFNGGIGQIYTALSFFDSSFHDWTWLSTSKKIDCIIFRMKDERASSILEI